MSDESIPAREDGEAVCGAADPQLFTSRRQFLFRASGALASAVVMVKVPGTLFAEEVPARVAEYPRRKVGRLSELTVGEPVPFDYPWDDTQSRNILMKLGRRAGGGVGPERDVVAFNAWCTHQGGPLSEAFKADPGVVGPCPLHWSTFDLTRHGMVVSGHATLGLPQILLETEGDDIYATAVIGLIFGYHDNTVRPGSGSGG